MEYDVFLLEICYRSHLYNPLSNIKHISVIGLGYVGLPFAIAICNGLSKYNLKGNVHGIDLDFNKISKIKSGF